jgi:hypothetical protein
MASNTTVAPQQFQFASQHNARFANKQANLVDLPTRLSNTLSHMSKSAQANWHRDIKIALNQFQKNHPALTTINSQPNEIDRIKFSVCQALDIPLNRISIDTTMQREPDMDWLRHIIANWRCYQAQPIQIYDTSKNLWGAWDGQHTALAFYIITVYGLGMKFEEVSVPCNIYNIQNRGQLRSTFISNNTYTGSQRGKKSLDMIDIVEQMIYGVEVDGVKDAEWVDWHTKWKILSANDLFFAATKFQNTGQTGAISRLDELGTASQEVVRQFAVYCKYVMDQQSSATQDRPIDTKELPLIIELLNMFEAESIRLTDDQVRDMAQHLIDKFGADFTTDGLFWQQVHQAVTNAWKSYNRSQNIPMHLWGNQPRNQKNVPTGYNFLWTQLATTWAPGVTGIRMPKRPGFAWTLSTQDLF